MHSDTDFQLLQGHLEGDGEAFAEIVRRHVNWIHGVARRRLGVDAHLAEDVTQATFLVLTRRSREIRPQTVLPAWLFRVACYLASNVRRSEQRRRRREREVALAVSPMSSDGDVAREWATIAPMIDDFVGRLRQSERDAILLRFYRQLSYSEIGDALGTTGEAARKRVDRALERLREIATRRGFSGASAALGVALTHGLATSAASAAPAGITAILATAANATTTTSANTVLAAGPAALAKGMILMSSATKLGIGIAVVALAIIGGTAAVVAFRQEGAPATAAAAPSSAATPAPDPPLLPGEAESIYGPDGVDQYGWTKELNEAVRPMKRTMIAAFMYASRNAKKLPPDLAATLPFAGRDLTARDRAALYVLPLDLEKTEVPEVVDAAWINEHTSYTYLAAGAPMSLASDNETASTTIVFHSSLSRPFRHAKHGNVILAIYVDGHGEILTLAQAQKWISTSKATIAKAMAATRPAASR